METRLLFPHRFKAIGWVLLAISTGLWMYVLLISPQIDFLNMKVFAIVYTGFLKGSLSSETMQVIEMNITYTLTGVLFIIGGILVAFSREKIEDEYIMKLRLVSLQWAVLVNHILLLIMFLLIYGLDFMTVMLHHMFSVLVLFILRFHYLLIRNRTPQYAE